MTWSETEVANLSCGYLGERAISDINDVNDTHAVILKRNLEPARQYTLRRFIWNFAKARIAVNRNPVAPLFDYSDSYTLPNDFIRFISINNYPIPFNPSQGYVGCRFEIGPLSQLLCNANGAPSIQIRYIQDVLDPSLWDNCFRRMVARQLALDCSPVLTKSPSITSQQAKLLSLETPEAVSITVQEQPLQRIQVSKSIEARRAYGQSNGSFGWSGDYENPWY